jgi:predicted RNase H-like HicB family nuclease
MHYPLVISRKSGSKYAACSPDLPNCLALGESMYEAVETARQELKNEIERRDKAGKLRPRPTDIDDLRERKEYANAITFVAISI